LTVIRVPWSGTGTRGIRQRPIGLLLARVGKAHRSDPAGRGRKQKRLEFPPAVPESALAWAGR